MMIFLSEHLSYGFRLIDACKFPRILNSDACMFYATETFITENICTGKFQFPEYLAVVIAY